MEIRHYRLQDKETVKDLHRAGICQMMENDPAGHPPDGSDFDCDLDDIEGVYLNNQGTFLIGTEDNEIIAIGALRPASEPARNSSESGSAGTASAGAAPWYWSANSPDWRRNSVTRRCAWTR